MSYYNALPDRAEWVKIIPQKYQKKRGELKMKTIKLVPFFATNV